MPDQANEQDRANVPGATPRRSLRRVLGPIAFLAAIGLLASRTCASEMAEVTFVVGVAAEVDEVELQLLQPNQTERVAFCRARPSGTPPVAQCDLQVQSGDYDVAITLHGSAGTHNDTRRVTVANRATIRIDVSSAATAN